MKATSTLTKIKILQLIDDARNAEFLRDLSLLKSILEPVWNCVETPDFSNFDKLIQAELYRACGFYWTFFGHQHNKENIQIRGRDLLTVAIKLFDDENLIEKSAEARIMLSFSFWNSGEVEESEIILENLPKEFSDDQNHPLFIQIACNRLMTLFWKNDLDEAVKLIKNTSPSLKNCSDLRLQCMFHNQAGIVYLFKKNADQSFYHFQQSSQFAEKINNLKFVAIIHNNIAMLFRDLGKYNFALESLKESEKLCLETDYAWLIPSVLDSRSLVYISQKKYEEALVEIDKAIRLFENGEDSRSLVEAFWTKITSLIALGRKPEVLQTFCELEKVASIKIGKTAVEKYRKLLADQIIFIGDAPLKESEKIYRQERVSLALRQSGGVQKIAAQKLGIGIGTMSDIVSNQFPVETFTDDGYKKRKTRLVASPSTKKEKTLKKRSSEILFEKPIAKILFANMPCTFDFEQFENFEVYLICAGQMKTFGIDYECLIAAETSPDFNDGDLLLIRDRTEWILGEVEFDEEHFIYVLTAPNGSQIEIESSNIAGKPIAYCPYSENLNIYNFTKLNKSNI